METRTALPVKLGKRTAARRMRSYRHRRRHKLRSAWVRISPSELDGLIAKGFLDPANRDDATAIGLAIEELIVDWLSVLV
jgi:hypothetical protein